MANLIRRKNPQPSYVTFEFSGMQANEVIVIPVTRSGTGKKGDARLAFMATAGVKISYTIDHVDEVLDAMKDPVNKGQSFPFLTSTGGKDMDGRTLPATTNPDSFARVWQTDFTILANDIHEIEAHATALRITAPAGAGAYCLVYGDY